MPLTPSQEAAVNSARKPLFIQAGAGTGKTFTLTKRIAHGLSPESGPLIKDVNRLLTITFTNKAAGELIGRVRAELRAQGLSEDALKIDAAWISTIHSMCKRILLSHAFEVGMDPGANLLGEDETSALKAMALDGLLRDRAGDASLAQLMGLFGSEQTVHLVSEFAGLLELSPQGPHGFELGPAVMSPRRGVQMLDQLHALHLDGIMQIEAVGIPQDKKTYVANYEAMKENSAVIGGWLAGQSQNASWAQISSLLESCGMLRGGKYKEPFGDIFGECREALLEAKVTAQSAMAQEVLAILIEYAVEHLERHRALKRARGALDTNDLLIAAYQLLAGNPAVAGQYQGAFDSIMVDEFQDTDSLQVGIVRRICDEGLKKLATVGDAQQSIYGFRGADLQVYEDMRETMRAHGSDEVELAVNYRSQPDILRFVEDIFSKPEFFGESFLKVESGRKPDSDPGWLKPEEPRVKILLAGGNKAPQGSGRSSVGQLRAADARALADEFERLHAQGASYGDMAILMQSTKSLRAGAYLRELRSRGIPCIVSGGSDFFTLPEVRVISMLLRVLADCDDDEALFELLGSNLFNASDDELLELSVVNKQRLKLAPDESRAKASLFDALAFAVRGEGTSAGPALERAFDVLSRALCQASSTPLARVVSNVVEESGWRATLRERGVEGGAIYANIERMCDMIEEHESLEGHSLFGVSEYFRNMIELAEEGSGARAKPGSMVSAGQDAVRIMTIHSSKGLEFPIVAVAEYEKSSSGKGASILSLSEAGKRYLALGVSGTGASVDYVTKDGPDPESFDSAPDATGFRIHAHRLARERQEQEQQRLFYVALTRARDMLIVVAHDSAFSSTGELPENLTGQFMRAVFGPELPRAHTVVRTQTQALVELCITDVPYEQGSQAGQDEAPRDALVEHVYPELSPAPRISAYVPHEREIFSYTSIARAVKAPEPPERPHAASIQLRDRSADFETVSPVGSAFHLVAQWLALTPHAYQQEIDFRLKAAARRFDLDEVSSRRLVKAVAAWVSSSCYASMGRYRRRYAEYPFCVDIEGMPLEGFIDLLCLDDNHGALVVDYKTGTSGQGEDLHERYGLQAHCYAYALLSAGVCDHLEMAFVRPEVDMEEVTFSFTKDDIPMLARRILEP